MSEATILQSIADQLHDVIEETRPNCPMVTYEYPEPRSYLDRVRFGPGERPRPKSARDVYNADATGITGYEFWPGLEPLYTLRERVQRYRSIAVTRDE